MLFQRLAMAVLLCLPLVSGCASGRQKAGKLAAEGGFRPVRFETSAFVLQGWLRKGSGETLNVYVEGDGYAYIRLNRPSGDPTPTDPVAFRLALADPGAGPVLYLGRPCQYVEGDDRRGCSEADWTGARFSARALAALDQAVDKGKALVGARSVALHGYSGGGAMAALLAGRRLDVSFLATVAGNLDHRLWTALHGDAPLADSLNPVDNARTTRGIPQLHVLGGKDGVIQPALLDSWVQHCGCERVVRVTMPEADHGGSWTEAWPELLRHWRKNAP